MFHKREMHTWLNWGGSKRWWTTLLKVNSYLNSGVILVYKVILNELNGQSAFPNATSPDNYQLVFGHSGRKREKVNEERVRNRKYQSPTCEKHNLYRHKLLTLTDTLIAVLKELNTRKDKSLFTLTVWKSHWRWTVTEAVILRNISFCVARKKEKWAWTNLRVGKSWHNFRFLGELFL